MREPTTWSEYLTSAMSAAGVHSDADLARAAKLPQSAISRWRKGAIPTDDSLRALMPVLGLAYLELAVASGRLTAAEAGMRTRPRPPQRPVGAGVDPELLADVERLSDAEVQRVKDFIRGIRAT